MALVASIVGHDLVSNRHLQGGFGMSRRVDWMTRSQLEVEVETLRLQCERLTRERDAYLRNLTSVQARCTELLLECRNLRRVPA